jgi:hypothetical protein
MVWRQLGLARSIAASALLTGAMFGICRAGDPASPVPTADMTAETVSVLQAEKSGVLAVEARGQGQESVRLKLKNTSPKRLNVVLPPGLIGVNATGQGGAGGGGGGQNMGFGAIPTGTNAFGRFDPRSQQGFASVPPAAVDEKSRGIVVPSGQEVVVDIPAVCLNFGLRTPGPRDSFKLVDVDDYSKDVRVRKALRALASLGTSHGMAQAAMWRVCNDLPFETMIEKGGKTVTPADVALASRFLEALDRSGDTIDPAYLVEGRVFVSIEGEGLFAKDARRIAGTLEGLRVMGLPVRVVAAGEAPKASAPALHLGVTLAGGPEGSTRAKVVVQASNGLGDRVDWKTLGQVVVKDTSSPAGLDAASLARSLDHAVSSGFVATKVARRSTGSTTIKVENRLPFTIAHLTVKAGASAGAPLVTLTGLGVGPGRTGMATVQAANATVDRVELNGL